MPRFVGRNNSATQYGVQASSPGSKWIGIAPTANFDFLVNDIDAADIRTQLGTLANLTFSEIEAGVQVRMVSIGTPVASNTTGVHAAVASNAANAFPGPITNPAQPRALACVFAVSYDGGNITIVGTDVNDQALTETVTAVANSTVNTVRAFKTVTSITKATVGATANTVSIGVANVFPAGPGINLLDNFGVLFVDGVAEAGTFNATNETIATGATAPNGTRRYLALVNV